MSAKVPFVDGTFDCDPQACFLDVVYHDNMYTYMLYMLAISYNSHPLLWAGLLIVTLRLAT